MNLNVVRDTESDWPNAIPSMEHFEKCIGDVSIVYVYCVLECSAECVGYTCTQILCLVQKLCYCNLLMWTLVVTNIIQTLS